MAQRDEKPIDCPSAAVASPRSASLELRTREPFLDVLRSGVPDVHDSLSPYGQIPRLVVAEASQAAGQALADRVVVGKGAREADPHPDAFGQPGLDLL